MTTPKDAVLTRDYTVPIGIPDAMAAVDRRSKAVLAAEEASASKIRLEMLRGQTLAEEDRYIELNKLAIQELEDELKRVRGEKT